MSGSLTVIGGAYGDHSLSGLVSVPSNFSTDFNTSLQLALSVASGLVTTGLVNLTNYDLASNTTFSTNPSVPGPTLYEITDTDSLGAVTTATGGSTLTGFTVPDSVSALVVEAPGYETITGNGTTSVALFGANSNVDYSVLTGSGSIFAAGGADSISIGSAADSPSYFVYSAGNDSIDLVNGADSVDATSGSTRLLLDNASGFVTADGSSTVAVFFQPNSGGTLNFVNNSGGAATIYSGAYTVPGGANVKALNAVTAYGGAGGGFYVGGLGGNNSLVGGSGVVTLQGGGGGDTLIANSSLGTNQLFSGPGAETLIGSSTSGSNTFQLNLKYIGQTVGVGGTDIVSTEGSGTQAFLLGAGNGTITGSTVSGAANVFDLIRDASVGAAHYEITNFASLQGGFLITDQTQAAGSSSIESVLTNNFGTVGNPNYVTTVTLTDHSTITFDGVQSSGLSISTDSVSGVITISHS